MNRQRGYALLLLTTIVTVSSHAMAGTDKIGEREFQTHCAVCHGADASGNGPMVEWLTVKPPSLRTLAKRNNGVFPWQRVYDILNGTRPVKLHGPSDMPVWGGRYAEKIIREKGEYDADSVQARILELVFYLATIQERK
jgi:mono/diheme cytochrome c family protein